MDRNLHTNLANPCKDPLVTPPHPDNWSRVLNQNNLSRDPNLSSDLIAMTYHAKEREPFQNLFLTRAHHPTQTKQTKSPSIGIQFVLFATNRRLEALWHSNKLFCSIKWKTRAAAAAAWQTTSSLNLMTWKKRQTNNADLGTQRLLSLHDYSRDQRRTRRRRRSIPISGTTSSAIQWRSNAPSTENRRTANSRNVAETFHREVSSTKKSLTRMTTLLVSANACKDETKKRTDFISFLGVRNCYGKGSRHPTVYLRCSHPYGWVKGEEC